MVDPVRYRHYSYFSVADYKEKNRVILTDYFKHMLRMDINYYKIMHKNKMYSLVNAISNEVGNSNYIDYFEDVSSKYDSVHEFLQVKSRFTK